MDAVVDKPPKRKRYLSQENRITPKMMKYAELLATGMPQGQAAREAGYKSKCSSTDLAKNPAVQRYLSALQNRVCAIVAYKVADAMQEAADTMQFAKEKGNPMAYCKAVELRAKLSGLLIDRVEVFSADLKGALAQAETRVINVSASIQSAQADEQAPTNTTVELPRLSP